MSFINQDSKIATHAALSQSVHGVGANDIADIADISTHASDTNTHGVDEVGESDLMTQRYLSIEMVL